MRIIRGLAGMALIAALAAACQRPASETTATTGSDSASAPAPDPVERGKYLVTVGGCHDCHTPKKMTPAGPEPDLSRSLIGHPAGEKLAGIPAGVIGPDKWGAVTNNHLTAWAGAWGVSFAMNLTPDKATGLGSWTPEMFVQALREGKHQGTGRAILPPMPWIWYRNMTDEDLRAIFAYLQSLPPVNNPVPEPLPPDRLPK